MSLICTHHLSLYTSVCTSLFSPSFHSIQPLDTYSAVILLVDLGLLLFVKVFCFVQGEICRSKSFDFCGKYFLQAVNYYLSNKRCRSNGNFSAEFYRKETEFFFGLFYPGDDVVGTTALHISGRTTKRLKESELRDSSQKNPVLSFYFQYLIVVKYFFLQIFFLNNNIFSQQQVP